MLRILVQVHVLERKSFLISQHIMFLSISGISCTSTSSYTVWISHPLQIHKSIRCYCQVNIISFSFFILPLPTPYSIHLYVTYTRWHDSDLGFLWRLPLNILFMDTNRGACCTAIMTAASWVGWLYDSVITIQMMEEKGKCLYSPDSMQQKEMPENALIN